MEATHLQTTPLQYYTIPSYTIPSCTIPSYTIPYTKYIPSYAMLYDTILYDTIYTILCCALLYHSIRYHPMRYHPILYRPNYTILYEAVYVAFWDPNSTQLAACLSCSAARAGGRDRGPKSSWAASGILRLMMQRVQLSRFPLKGSVKGDIRPGIEYVVYSSRYPITSTTIQAKMNKNISMTMIISIAAIGFYNCSYYSEYCSCYATYLHLTISTAILNMGITINPLP